MSMKLSNLGLQAFHHCALTLNVTEAAMKLGITQSALSQRLASLESDLEVTLFIRDPKGLILTAEGERLLRFTQSSVGLEDELLQALKGNRHELGGPVRIAGFSSILRSMIIPTLAPFFRRHPKVHGDFQSYEVFELPKVLATGRADLVILDYELGKKGIIQESIGVEEYVVIESVKYQSPQDVYLDNGPHDNATESFFQFQSKEQPYRRSFMGDVYGIIEGVEEGLGRAVMSKHLVSKNKKVKILKGFRPYKRPIVLHYYERSFYPELINRTINELKENLKT